ncbi:MAG: HDOD domain-containing protein [Gammaproteobacteria bacterium]
MTKSLDELVSDANSLIAFPAVVSEFNNAVNQESTDSEKLGSILQVDPALTAKLLQLSNSAYFGTSIPVENVKDAIFRLGIKQTRDLVYGICAKNSFNGITNDLITSEDFWKHSLICALSAREIAKSIKLHPADTMFTAGLLHDIGDLVLFSFEPEKSAEAVAISLDEYDGMHQSDAERAIFKFDHTDVGGRLSHHWGLPEILRTCIANHHKPGEQSQYAKQVAVIHVANAVSELIEVNSHDFSQCEIIDDSIWKLLATDSSVIESCFSVVQEEYDDMSKLMFN